MTDQHDAEVVVLTCHFPTCDRTITPPTAHIGNLLASGSWRCEAHDGRRVDR